MQLAEMFRDHPAPRAVIECAIEGVLGNVNVTDAEGPPAARIDLGCYAIFGGAAESGASLVESARPLAELIVPDDQRWRDLLVEIWGERLEDRPMRTFAAHALDTAHLEELTATLPPGLSIERLQRETAGQLDAELVPHALQVFRDAAHFEERGLGFGVIDAGRVVAASTSYAISSRRVEVSISTRPTHRGRGLATAIAARMLHHCLEQGKTPDWSAANPVSKHLAAKLGFRPAVLCDVFYLKA